MDDIKAGKVLLWNRESVKEITLKVRGEPLVVQALAISTLFLTIPSAINFGRQRIWDHLLPGPFLITRSCTDHESLFSAKPIPQNSDLELTVKLTMTEVQRKRVVETQNGTSLV